MNSQSLKLLALSKLNGIGPAALKDLAKLPRFNTADVDELSTFNNKLKKALEKPGAWNDALASANSEIEQCQKFNARIICTLDDDYPELLRLTPDHPYFIYVRGEMHTAPKRSVAVIGTRQPTEHGKTIASRITQFLVEEGWSIVSGLAIGCDSIAHQSAIKAKGHTVAVLAHGLHTIAPKQNENLAREIIDSGGMLVTEYGFGIDPFAHQFVKRDRIQAGLASGVVMIQSDLIGGSLHASRASIEYGRLLAVPRPTEIDLSNKEMKIEANSVLAGADDQKKISLLKCKADDLKRVFVINNREDYPTLSNMLSPSNNEKAPNATSIKIDTLSDHKNNQGETLSEKQGSLF